MAGVCPASRDTGLLSAIMSRSHNAIIRAERKNRLERTYLDQKLKGLERDSARMGFLVERQQRSIVSKWKVIALTTGHSNRALPPDGPNDDVYRRSKYCRQRLTEKRLKQWQLREKHLEIFLRQYDPRPHTSLSTSRTSRYSSCWPGEKITPLVGEKGRSQNTPLLCRSQSVMSGIKLSSRMDPKFAPGAHNFESAVSGRDESGSENKNEVESKANGETERNSLQNKQSPHSFDDNTRPDDQKQYRESHGHQKASSLPCTARAASNSPIPEGLEKKNGKSLLYAVHEYDAFARTRYRSNTGVKFLATKDRMSTTNSLQKSYDRREDEFLSRSNVHDIDRTCRPNAETSHVASRTKTMRERVAGFEMNSRENHEIDYDPVYERPRSVDCLPAQMVPVTANTDYRHAQKMRTILFVLNNEQTKGKDTVANHDFANEECKQTGPKIVSKTAATRNSFRDQDTQSRQHNGHSSSLEVVERRPPSQIDNSTDHQSQYVDQHSIERTLKTLLMKQQQQKRSSSDLKPQVSASTSANSPQNEKNQNTDWSPPKEVNISNNEETTNGNLAESTETRKANSKFRTRVTDVLRGLKHEHQQADSATPSDDQNQSQRRRDLKVEQPAGLRSSMSSLGTVVKAAMVFSKGARKQALNTMVDENNTDLRKAIQKERIRVLQSRTSLLNKIMLQFPLKENP